MRRLLLIVVTSFLLSTFAAFAVIPSIIDRKIDEVFVDLIKLRQAVEIRRQDGLPLPDEHKGLNALLEAPAFFDRLPDDGWSSAYLYKRIDARPGYVIYSAGKNGVDEGGYGDDVTDTGKSYSCEDYGVGCTMDVVTDNLFIVASVLALLSMLAVLGISGAMLLHHLRMRHAA